MLGKYLIIKKYFQEKKIKLWKHYKILHSFDFWESLLFFSSSKIFLKELCRFKIFSKYELENLKNNDIEYCLFVPNRSLSVVFDSFLALLKSNMFAHSHFMTMTSHYMNTHIYVFLGDKKSCLLLSRYLETKANN